MNTDSSNGISEPIRYERIERERADEDDDSPATCWDCLQPFTAGKSPDGKRILCLPCCAVAVEHA